MGTIFATVAAYLGLINNPDMAKLLKEDTTGIMKGTTLGIGAFGANWNSYWSFRSSRIL